MTNDMLAEDYGRCGNCGNTVSLEQTGFCVKWIAEMIQEYERKVSNEIRI